MWYPKVLTEAETIDIVLEKYRGFARFGDGDFAVMRGQRDRFQKWDPALARMLAQSLARPSPHVLNCIPREVTVRNNHHWLSFTEANAGIIPLLTQEFYGSANISRMDSEPHLHTPEWWRYCAKLWKNLNVTLVRGSERSLTAAMLRESPEPPLSVVEVLTAPSNSWEQFDDIYERVQKVNNQVVLLCNGLVTRPLVHRLADADFYAYDLGHLGVWFEGGLPRTECRP